MELLSFVIVQTHTTATATVCRKDKSLISEGYGLLAAAAAAVMPGITTGHGEELQQKN